MKTEMAMVISLNKNPVNYTTYQGKEAKTNLIYGEQDVYPLAAQTVTLLNTADLFYREYAPADEEGGLQIPHELTYKDGKIELALTLISWK